MPEIPDTLDPATLDLPDRPRVAAIAVVPYVDSTGDDALEVTITIDVAGRADEGFFANIRLVERAIRDRLGELVPSRWPYFRYLTPADVAELEAEARRREAKIKRERIKADNAARRPGSPRRRR